MSSACWRPFRLTTAALALTAATTLAAPSRKSDEAVENHDGWRLVEFRSKYTSSEPRGDPLLELSLQPLSALPVADRVEEEVAEQSGLYGEGYVDAEAEEPNYYYQADQVVAETAAENYPAEADEVDGGAVEEWREGVEVDEQAEPEGDQVKESKKLQGPYGEALDPEEQENEPEGEQVKASYDHGDEVQGGKYDYEAEEGLQVNVIGSPGRDEPAGDQVKEDEKPTENQAEEEPPPSEAEEAPKDQEQREFRAEEDDSGNEPLGQEVREGKEEETEGLDFRTEAEEDQDQQPESEKVLVDEEEEGEYPLREFAPVEKQPEEEDEMAEDDGRSDSFIGDAEPPLALEPPLSMAAVEEELAKDEEALKRFDDEQQARENRQEKDKTRLRSKEEEEEGKVVEAERNRMSNRDSSEVKRDERLSGEKDEHHTRPKPQKDSQLRDIGVIMSHILGFNGTEVT
jgi:hypothetical protein